MEEFENLTQDDILELIGKDKDGNPKFPYKPLGHKVIISLNTVEANDMESMEESTESLSEEQYVIATGNYVNDAIKSGQKVILDLMQMQNKSGSIPLDPLEYKNMKFAYISDRMIKSLYLA